MKRMMIPASVFVALIGVAFVLRSRPASIELAAATAAMPSLLELRTMAGVNKLPMQEREDQSLVYPTVEKRRAGLGASGYSLCVPKTMSASSPNSKCDGSRAFDPAGLADDDAGCIVEAKFLRRAL